MHYAILGHYDPPKWNPKLIAKDLLAISRRTGLVPLEIGNHRLHKGVWKSRKLHADVMRRSPAKKTADLDWHQDGDISDADMDHSILLWTSNTPTQVRVDGEEIEVPDRAVVLINNLKCEHRRPPNTPRKRWLFRQRVETPEWLK